MKPFIFLMILFLPVQGMAQIEYEWDVIPEQEYHKTAVGVRIDFPHLSDENDPSGTGVIFKITDEVVPTKNPIPFGRTYYKGYVLTCWHVAELDNGEGRLVIKFRGGEQSRAKVIQWNFSEDWAILEVLIPSGYKAAEISPVDPKPGDILECVGLGGGMDISGQNVRRFRVTAGRTTTGEEIRVDDLVTQGDSGGPVFLDGKLVGLISAGRADFYFDPLTRCKTFWGGLFVGVSTFRDECLKD